MQSPDLDRKVCLECHRQFTGIVAACPHDNSMLVPVAQDPLIGTKLAGKYEIVSVLGTGGMGVVYKGRQDIMDRTVAIKMLQAHHLNDSMSVKRFQQESKATCKLNHPHIITVYDFGISPSGQPYIVMDYLEGEPLSDIIKNDGQVGVDRALTIFTQACMALDHAHKQKVLHRDLKPSNIVLIEHDGQEDYVKVVDFGVAKIMEESEGGSGSEHQKLTQMGEVCGSPVYMSPEQCQGMSLDRRSDIYSMGIVMYETLTNRLPILGKTMVETMSKHIKDMPPTFNESRPDLYIPERIEQVIFRALSKDPDDRQQSMEQLAVELEMAIPRPGKSQVLRTQEFPETTEKPVDQSPVAALTDLVTKMTVMHWLIALGVALGIGGFGVVLVWNLSKEAAKPKIHQTVPPPAPQAVTTPVVKDNNSKTGGLSGAKPASTAGPDKKTAPGGTDSGAKIEPVKEAPVAKPKPKPKPKPRPRAKKPTRAAKPVAKPKPKPKKNDVFKNLLKERSY